MQRVKRANKADRRQLDATKLDIASDDSSPDETPASTRWHRDHGRPTIEQKAVSQQYLTPEEEIELREYMFPPSAQPNCMLASIPVRIDSAGPLFPSLLER